MRNRWARCVGPALLPFVASCILTPFMVNQKKISPEFDKLAQSRVAVLVWTDPATLFDYPHARFELATYVGEKLTAEMAQRLLGMELTDPRDVEDFLQKDIDAQIDPVAVGRQFDVDYVVYLEVFEFQIRDAQAPQLLRGKINASVTVHDIRADPDRAGRYELTPVDCIYPEGGPVVLTATNAPLVRESTYRKFAEQVARKFYEHTVDL
ncbi:MAG: hypothetical protein ACYTFA_07070 [Planctomycetota bacterium]